MGFPARSLLLMACLAARLAAAESAALPPEDELAKHQRQIQDLYKSEYASKDLAARSALARKLLDFGRNPEADPAERVALLREAGAVAAKAGDLATVRAAVGSLTAAWEFDTTELRLKLYASTPIGPANPPAEAVRDLIEAGSTAIAADQYPQAQKLDELAEQLSRRANDQALAARAKAAAQDAQELGSEYDKLSGTKKWGPVLSPEERTALGRFYALAKADWAKALPLLAEGSDESLKALAAADLAAQDRATREAAADGWADFARKAPAKQRAGLYRRAVDLYRAALDGATGLAQARLEKRVADLSPLAATAKASAGFPANPALYITGETASEHRTEAGAKPKDDRKPRGQGRTDHPTQSPGGDAIVDVSSNRVELETRGIVIEKEGANAILRCDGKGRIRVQDATGTKDPSFRTDADLTLSLWLRPATGLGYFELFSKDTECQLTYGNNSLRFSCVDQAKAIFRTEAETTFKAEVWVHVGVVRDFGRKQFQFWIDGKARPAESFQLANIRLAQYPIHIGNSFKGDLDDIAIWTRALSDAEMAALYESTRAGR